MVTRDVGAQSGAQSGRLVDELSRLLLLSSSRVKSASPDEDAISVKMVSLLPRPLGTAGRPIDRDALTLRVTWSCRHHWDTDQRFPPCRPQYVEQEGFSEKATTERTDVTEAYISKHLHIRLKATTPVALSADGMHLPWPTIAGWY